MGKPEIRPTPRLEFRWRYSEESEMERSDFGRDMRFACDYGIVMPVSPNDCRSNVYSDEGEAIGARSEVFYKFSTTLRGGESPPTGQEVPYRDGAHARWDAKTLGGLEVWVKNLWGELNRLPEPEARAAAE